MDETIDVIFKVIRQIQDQKSLKSIPLNEDLKVVEELGFRSLDVAQLIAILGLRLKVYPFSEGVSLMEVHTIGDLKQVYQTSIDQKILNGEQA